MTIIKGTAMRIKRATRVNRYVTTLAPVEILWLSRRAITFKTRIQIDIPIEIMPLKVPPGLPKNVPNRCTGGTKIAGNCANPRAEKRFQ